jgi:hypothetical protein
LKTSSATPPYTFSFRASIGLWTEALSDQFVSVDSDQLEWLCRLAADHGAPDALFKIGTLHGIGKEEVQRRINAAALVGHPIAVCSALLVDPENVGQLSQSLFPSWLSQKGNEDEVRVLLGNLQPCHGFEQASI